MVGPGPVTGPGLSSGASATSRLAAPAYDGHETLGFHGWSQPAGFFFQTHACNA